MMDNSQIIYFLRLVRIADSIYIYDEKGKISGLTTFVNVGVRRSSTILASSERVRQLELSGGDIDKLFLMVANVRHSVSHNFLDFSEL